MFLPLKPHLPAISYFPFLISPSLFRNPLSPTSVHKLPLFVENTPSQSPARRYSFPNSGAKILLPKLRCENTPSQTPARKYSFPSFGTKILLPSSGDGAKTTSQDYCHSRVSGNPFLYEDFSEFLLFHNLQSERFHIVLSGLGRF